MDDPTILQWAAEQGRVLITHHIRTMPTSRTVESRNYRRRPECSLCRARCRSATLSRAVGIAAASEPDNGLTGWCISCCAERRRRDVVSASPVRPGIRQSG